MKMFNRIPSNWNKIHCLETGKRGCSLITAAVGLSFFLFFFFFFSLMEQSADRNSEVYCQVPLSLSFFAESVIRQEGKRGRD